MIATLKLNGSDHDFLVFVPGFPYADALDALERAQAEADELRRERAAQEIKLHVLRVRLARAKRQSGKRGRAKNEFISHPDSDGGL